MGGAAEHLPVETAPSMETAPRTIPGMLVCALPPCLAPATYVVSPAWRWPHAPHPLQSMGAVLGPAEYLG